MCFCEMRTGKILLRLRFDRGHPMWGRAREGKESEKVVKDKISLRLVNKSGVADERADGSTRSASCEEKRDEEAATALPLGGAHLEDFTFYPFYYVFVRSHFTF